MMKSGGSAGGFGTRIVFATISLKFSCILGSATTWDCVAEQGHGPYPDRASCYGTRSCRGRDDQMPCCYI